MIYGPIILKQMNGDGFQGMQIEIQKEITVKKEFHQKITFLLEELEPFHGLIRRIIDYIYMEETIRMKQIIVSSIIMIISNGLIL